MTTLWSASESAPPASPCPIPLIDELAGLAEGHTRKVLADVRVKGMGISTLLAVTRVLGIRGTLHVDPALVKEMQPSLAETR
jgi:hypothetical protein